MSARRLVTEVAALLAGVTALSPAAPAQSATVQLSVQPREAATLEGDDFVLRSTIRNAGRTALSGLVAHLNIVSWDAAVYVDPEDWSSERTRYLRSLPPGGSLNLTWPVTAVSGGHFAVYVVVVPPHGRGVSRPLAVSPDLDVHVTERAGLDSGGLAPLVVGVPTVLGAGALALRAARRRQTGASPARS
jgi:hypothetical protein